MPSRKGKGRQSLGFASKAQHAEFHKEWQQRLNEDYYAKKKRQQKEQQQRQKQQQRWNSMRQKSDNVITNLRNCKNNSSGDADATSTTASTATSKQPQSRLRRLIEERRYWDRLEDRRQQATRLISATYGDDKKADPTFISRPGWLVYHDSDVDDFARDYYEMLNARSAGVPTLQTISLQAVACALPQYMEALGVDTLHHYLSLLPAPALMVLSVEASRMGLMTNDLARALGRHSHITRFSLVSCARCDETDPNWKDLQPNAALEQTFLSTTTIATKKSTNQPKPEEDDNAVNNCTTIFELLRLPENVPDNWEDRLVDEEEEEDKKEEDNDESECTVTFASHQTPLLSVSSASVSHWSSLTHLELGNLPLLEIVVLEQVLRLCPMLTHLGLSGSLPYDDGPDALWNLSQWAPRLQLLDVSANAWITAPLLRSVYESFCAMRLASANTVSSSINSSAGSGISCRHQGRNNSLVIRARGCLSKSNQLIMKAEFGTLFE